MPGLSPGHDQSAANHAPERFVGHAMLVSALTLVSRFTGLGRDAVLAAVFGTSLWLDAFLIGFQIPNLFRRLFGEGALTAAFIPRYSRLRQDDPALARRFASLCVVAVGLLLTVITLVGELVLFYLLEGAQTRKLSLAIELTMVMLPYMPMVCGVAFLGAVLQVHRRFGPPAAAPVLLNAVMIAAALGIAWRAGSEAAGIGLLAWSVLLAGVLQLLWLGWQAARIEPLTLHFAGTGMAFKGMLLTMLPMVVGLGVFQINTLLDGLIAYSLAAPPGQPDATLHILGRERAYPIENGAVTVLTLAQRLYQFPLGVFAIAISTAIFPALAAAWRPSESDSNASGTDASGAATPGGATSGGEAFAEIFHRGLRLTLFIGLPASVGLMLVRVPLARAFFQWYAFSLDDALRTATLVAAYASAVWAYSTTHVVTRAFYAADDALAPLKISVGIVVLNFLLNLVLIWPLGAAGLAWSTAITAMLQVALLLVTVRRHVGRVINADVLAGWVRTAGLSAVMGLAVYLVSLPMDLTGSGKIGVVGQLAALVAVGAAVYGGGAVLLRCPEVRWIRRRSAASVL